MWIDWCTGHWKTALQYRAQMIGSNDVLYVTWAKRISGMIDLDLGLVDEALQELEDSLPAAVRANEYQTTVPHWGQLARAYAVGGREDKTTELINQILEFISRRDYISIEFHPTPSDRLPVERGAFHP